MKRKGDAKQCSKCRENKSILEFTKNTHQPDGLYSYCRPCTAIYRKQNRPKYNEALSRWKIRNPDKVHADGLKRHYGITKEDYNKMLELQNYSCAICKSSESKMPTTSNNRFCVDHCHDSNKIRGLLCFQCNVGIGNFKDDIDVLSAAIKYLKENRNENKIIKTS